MCVCVLCVYCVCVLCMCVGEVHVCAHIHACVCACVYIIMCVRAWHTNDIINMVLL